MKIIIGTVLSLLFFSANGQGRVDGFYKGVGNTEIVLGVGKEKSNSFYAGNNKINAPRSIKNISIYIATGITPKLDLYIAAPYVIINSEKSIQDGSVFLKYQIKEFKMNKGTFSVSAATGFSDNLAEYQTEGGSAIGQEAKILDFRPVFHYMRDGYFGTIQAAYQIKDNPTPDAINAAFKVGHAGAKLYYDVWYDFQKSDGGFNYRGTPAPSTFKSLGVDYHKIGATVYKSVNKRVGFALNVGAVLSGRNIGNGKSANLALIWKNL